MNGAAQPGIARCGLLNGWAACVQRTRECGGFLPLPSRHYRNLNHVPVSSKVKGLPQVFTFRLRNVSVNYSRIGPFTKLEEQDFATGHDIPGGCDGVV